jgi:hypothetical protein
MTMKADQEFFAFEAADHEQLKGRGNRRTAYQLGDSAGNQQISWLWSGAPDGPEGVGYHTRTAVNANCFPEWS